MEFKMWNTDKGFEHSIRVDNFDAWNADYTMSIVIHNVLKELLRQDSGTGYMHIEDVSEEFLNEWKGDGKNPGGYSTNAWKWMIKEIIWATNPDWEDEYFTSDSLKDGSYYKHQDRRANAMKLFGKYFFGFWN